MAEPLTLPVLALRDVVVFPQVTLPIGVGRPASLKALEASSRDNDRLVFAVAQRDGSDKVSPESLYTIGTVARIGQVQRGLSGMQLLLQGEQRGIAVRIIEKDGYLEAVVREAEEMPPLDANDPAFVGLYRELRERAAELGQKAGLPRRGGAAGARRASRTRAASPTWWPRYTEMTPWPSARSCSRPCRSRSACGGCWSQVQQQLSVLDAQEDIKSKVQEELGDRQREMFLREQMKAIQKELGEERGAATTSTSCASDSRPSSCRRRRRRRSTASCGRLQRIGREAMESQVIRTFLETVAELPWNERSEEHARPEAGVARSSTRTTTAWATSRTACSSSWPCASCGSRHERDREQAEAAAEAAEAEGSEPAAEAAPVAVAERDDPGRRGASAAGRGGRRWPEVPPASRRPRHQGSRGPLAAQPDPALRRPAGRRQDLDRQVDRPRHGPQVRAHLAGRRARRGRHPRPPAHLRRRHARPHHPGHEAGGHQEPGLPARRGRQARRLVPGRPGGGAARGARPGAERLASPTTTWACRSTSPRCCSSPPRTSSRTSRGRCSTAWRWSSSPATPSARSCAIARRYLVPRQLKENGLSDGAARGSSDSRLVADRSPATPARPACASSSARSAGWRARWRGRSPPARSTQVDGRRRPWCATCSAGPRCTRSAPPRRTRSASRPACTTRRWAATSCSSRRRPCAGKGELILTGQLGDVMKESARAAWSYARVARAAARHPRRRLQARPAHPRAGRRHPQGRPVGGRHHGDGAGLGPLRAAGAAATSR